MRYAAVLVLAIAIVAFMEWSTDEDMITMLAIALASGVTGWLYPKSFLISGLAIGLVVPGIALFSQATGLHPAYETAAEAAKHGLPYAASLLILVIPALIASVCGRWIRRLATRNSNQAM